MTDYGHALTFGSFLTPSQQSPESVVALAQLSEELGLDLVTFQDHPYQPAFLDTWTLMSYVAAATIQIKIAPNVLNLPLRQPAVVARSAASLDLLSGGRFELGLGAGAYWDAIAAMGGTRLGPGESVVALGEAIEIIRAIWDTGTRGGVRVDGEHHQVRGAKRGPAPAHPIEIWLGALKPRILRLTGRMADGWLPSSSYLPPSALAAANTIIDDAARAAGRAPTDIRRLYNIVGAFAARGGGFLQGPPDQWVHELTGLALEQGFSTFILGSDDPTILTTYAEEVAPAVRQAVAMERAASSTPPPQASNPQPVAATPEGQQTQARRLELGEVLPRPEPAGFPIVATPDDGTRLTDARWDETARPRGPEPVAGREYSSRDLGSAQQLIDVHNHLRGELTQIRDLVSQVLMGTTTPDRARSAINEMAVRQNNWTVGAYCAAYCRLVTTHHTLEDQALFPRLRRSDPALVPVVDRLHWEHEVIHQVLDAVDQALVLFVGADNGGAPLQLAIDQLTDTLLSHLSYEERELVEPIARLGLII